MTTIEKIRAEIEELDRYYDNDYFSTNNCPMYKCNEVLQIFDKYAEQEPCDYSVSREIVEPTCDTCEYNTAAFMPCNACEDKSEYKPQESEGV